MKRRSFFWLALMALVLSLAGPISQIRAAEVSYRLPIKMSLPRLRLKGMLNLPRNGSLTPVS